MNTIKPSRKFALAMDLPEGKRAGYYAQIVKALAGKAALYDREKELLIFATEEERSEAEPIMEQYAIPWEPMDLLQLPAPVQTYRTFDDFGFISRLDNVYVYADLISVFQLAPDQALGRQAEPQGALAQLDEHLVALCPTGSGAADALCAIETQHRELADGIARAYGCHVHWYDT
ncbi:hypothetical protein [Paenibacillus cremeus]|uniref:Uncharacterized protein n=1 Tax=Paenibacillus cremeus TaxID=2163881 RepID=A0A559KBW1_9BACL|nr:hypothetical protein [Paenibacillus cremeus]TVY09620.1 hypothetical protein FPZ49_12855 [Paenibacillus cremeus]